MESKLMKYILALVMLITATLCYADGEYTTDGNLYLKSDVDLRITIPSASSLQFGGKKYRWKIDEKAMMDMTPKEIDDMTVAIKLFTLNTFYTGEFIDVFCSKYLPDRYRTVEQKKEGGK